MKNIVKIFIVSIFTLVITLIGLKFENTINDSKYAMDEVKCSHVNFTNLKESISNQIDLSNDLSNELNNINF